MKKILAILFILINSTIYATMQAPDFLIFQNIEYKVDTGWGHPSIIERYYIDKNIPSQFYAYSTGNYRGHIATWEIKDNRLHLVKLTDGRDNIKQENYKDYDLEFMQNDNIYIANWFSGPVLCYNETNSIIFDIKNGKVKKYSIYDNEEVNTYGFNKLSGNKLKKMILKKKYENYVEYFFRLYSSQYILYQEKKFEIISNRNEYPILNYNKYNHNLWPYNWNNLIKHGAPIGHWTIINDKIILKDLSLYYGTGFNKYDTDIPNYLYLKLKGYNLNKNSFASWINGIYLLVNYKDDYKNEYEEIHIIKVKDGIILESFLLPNDVFQLEYNGPAKSLLKEYNESRTRGLFD